MKLKPKLYILGHGRHGKDTVAEIIRDHYRLKFVSSSWFCAERIVFPALSAKYGYASVQECFDDRYLRRSEWFDLIAAYNSDDPAKLSREIFSDNDMYVGLRNASELEAYRKENPDVFTVWVDASKRMPEESATSITVTPEHADFVISNNDIREMLVVNTHRVMARVLDEDKRRRQTGR